MKPSLADFGLGSDSDSDSDSGLSLSWPLRARSYEQGIREHRDRRLNTKSSWHPVEVAPNEPSAGQSAGRQPPVAELMGFLGQASSWPLICIRVSLHLSLILLDFRFGDWHCFRPLELGGPV